MLLFFNGSLPFLENQEAIEFIKTFSPHLPFLPQLPEANPQEDPLAQTLRGMELGYWDETACSSLELFQNEFVDAKVFKIQIIGPYSMSRSLSSELSETLPAWGRFAYGLFCQLRDAGFNGDIWYQIDEPYWRLDSTIPVLYFQGLKKIQMRTKNVVWGFHSCSKERPLPTNNMTDCFEFFSLNFLGRPLVKEEAEIWTQLSKSGKALIQGILQEKAQMANENKKRPGMVSAPCGLSDWDRSDIRRYYGELIKGISPTELEITL